MKIHSEVVFMLNLMDDGSQEPVVSGKAIYSLDCTEAEHALCMETFKKISDDWLELKQEFVKSLISTPSFKAMVSAAWTVVTDLIKKAA
jgi:hypothetical protein